jgi:hypothetical protein
LANARKLRDEAKKKLFKRLDPSLAKKLEPYPVTQITATDVLAVLFTIEKSGRVES